MQSLQAAREGVGGAVHRLLTVQDEALHTADVVVADWSLRLRTPCADTTDLYARRLRGRDAASQDGAARFSFTLLEVGSFDWTPTSHPPEHFSDMVADLGFTNVHLSDVEPCTIFDPDRNIGVQLVTRIADMPPWHTGAPFRIMLHLAAVNQGWSLVHAATLGDGDDGVLIIGPGKIGKSGTTLAGIAGGLKTVGDDYVLVRPGNPPTALRAYNLLKQDRHGIARIAGLAEATAHVPTNWQDKLELDPDDLFPGCVVETMRLRAILSPNIAHARKTVFVPTDPQTVFQQFWPSLWAQLPVAQAAGFKFAASLTRSLPTFTMLLSDETTEIADSIRQFIAGLRR
jgi:hypothetical protein